MLHRHRTLSWAKLVLRVSLPRVAVLRQLALQRVGFDDPAQFLGADWPGHEQPVRGIPGFGFVSGPVRGKRTGTLSFARLPVHGKHVWCHDGEVPLSPGMADTA